MKRTKGKPSPWQSGTIAPKFFGPYERRYNLAGNYIPIGYGIFDGRETWYIATDSGALSESAYRVRNGNYWQWRGIIEDDK